MLASLLVTPDEIRALRKSLKCTMQELADALGIEARVVMEWEDGEMFPTRRHVEKMKALSTEGPSAVPRKGRRRAAESLTPMQVLADPELWRLVRKLLCHAELRKRALELAETYDEPT